MAKEGGISKLSPYSGSVGASIAGAGIGAAGIGVALAERDAPAGVIAYGAKQAAVAEGILNGTVSQLAHRIGVTALTASTLYDIAKATKAYEDCMAGAAG